MSLNAFKSQVDDIDNKILNLLEKRKLISKMIKKIQKKKGEVVNQEISENSTLERLRLRTKSLKGYEIDGVFRSIFNLGILKKESLKVSDEKPLVAYY